MASTSGTEGARFKGKLGIAVRKAIKERTGHLSQRELMRHVPAHARWMLEERFIATKWYPLPGAADLLLGVAQALGQPALELSRAIGADITMQEAGAVGRTIISLFGSPARMARYLEPMRNQLYDGGRVRGHFDESTRRLTVELDRWPGHHTLLCMTMLGSLEAIARQLGEPALVASRRVACMAEGEPQCRFELDFA